MVLHFWGTGGGALPVVSYLFMRDLCIRIGSGCIDECFKGIYKAYVLNCHFVNAVKLKHIRFLGNCVIELLGVDLAIAYQHAFIYIRQLAMILRDALNAKTKVLFYLSTACYFLIRHCKKCPLPFLKFEFIFIPTNWLYLDLSYCHFDRNLSIVECPSPIVSNMTF